MAIQLAILVVLFNPTDEDLHLLGEISRNGVPLYLIDNSPHKIAKVRPGRLLHQGKNIGLSRAYNLAFHQIRDDGYSHVLVFDQDTRISPETIPFVCSVLLVQPRAGMLNFSQTATGNGARPVPKDLVVNSATAFSLDIHARVKGFNERFFVDCVDYDYCLRCLRAGESVLQVGMTPGLDHRSGQPEEVTVVLGRRLIYRQYGWKRSCEILWGHFYLVVLGLRSGKVAWAGLIARGLLLFLFGRTITALRQAARLLGAGSVQAPPK